MYWMERNGAKQLRNQLLTNQFNLFTKTQLRGKLEKPIGRVWMWSHELLSVDSTTVCSITRTCQNSTRLSRDQTI